MRELLEEERVHQDRRARLAIEKFCHRVKHYLGAYLAQMNGADAIVFTGGIGERATSIRASVCEGAAWIGVALDRAANEKHGPRVSTAASRVAAWVVPTNEELMIARHTERVIGG
jgi:acetate kinase